MDTARPMPLSPPVIMATLPLSLAAAFIGGILEDGPGLHHIFQAGLDRLVLRREGDGLLLQLGFFAVIRVYGITVHKNLQDNGINAYAFTLF